MKEFQKNIFDNIFEDIEYYKTEAITQKNLANELEKNHAILNQELKEKDLSIVALDKKHDDLNKDQEKRTEHIKSKVDKE